MTVDVQLELLGPPSVRVGGERRALPLERRTQLAVLLVLRRAWVPRSDAAAMLWPGLTGAQAFANLRKTLFRMPQLGWAQPLEATPASLRLELPNDVSAFDTALAAGHVDEALALYRGELLPGFDDGRSEEWTRGLAFERERLRALWRSAALARLDAGQAGPGQALELATRLLDADPLDEAALAHQLAALAGSGQYAAAQAAGRRFVERLRDELGLSPGAELRALLQRHGSGQAEHAPARAAATRPTVDGDFVGRAVELRRISELLQPGQCRLLCLVGPGGVGKTRLARRAMQMLAGHYDDGASFLSLEDIDSPEQFGLQLAQLARSAGTASQGDALAPAIAAWRDRRLLLVLDNFEPLAAHAGLLARLLHDCPRLQLLVTSRLRLALAEAWTLPIEGLPCPDPEDGEHIETFDAVRLFAKSAQRVEPRFLVRAERNAVVDICRQVGGLPLALELAAAWVRLLPCRDIAAELRRGAELLSTPDPGRASRHASMETVFDQSWRRLADAERDALMGLSVCRGGCTVDAARAIVGASLPVLGALVDKSLLARDGERLQLHPLVQQLAAARLQTAGGSEAVERRHAAYFHRWLRTQEPGVTVGRHDALQAVEAEFDNCRAAWAASAAQRRPDELLQGLVALHHYAEHRARFEPCLALLGEALDTTALQGEPFVQAHLQVEAAWLEFRLQRFARARAAAARSLEGARGVQLREVRWRARLVQAHCTLSLGEPLKARRIYRHALALARGAARAGDIAATLDNLALCDKQLGRYDSAYALTVEALALHRGLHDHARTAKCLNNLAALCITQGRLEPATAHLRDALELAELHGLPQTQAMVLGNLCEVAQRQGDQVAAQRHARRALQLAESAGLRTLIAWVKLVLSRLAAEQGDLEAARRQLAEGAALAAELGSKALQPNVLLSFALVLEAAGHAAAARRVLDFGAHEPSLAVPDRAELHSALAERGKPDAPDPPWPGLSLAELLARIVAEAPLAHAPLLAALG